MEKGSEGTPHIQGYVYFKNAVRWLTMKGKLDDDHFEPAKGNALQNKAYCSKEEGRIDGPFEYGDIPKQGERTDIATACEVFKTAKSLMAAVEEHPVAFVKYNRGMKDIYNMFVPPRDYMTKLILLYGVSGEGKSYLARLFPSPYIVPKATSTQFYDGYDAKEHQTIIFDDFKGT